MKEKTKLIIIMATFNIIFVLMPSIILSIFFKKDFLTFLPSILGSLWALVILIFFKFKDGEQNVK